MVELFDSMVDKSALLFCAIFLHAAGALAQTDLTSEAVEPSGSDISTEHFEDWQLRCVISQTTDEPAACELSQSVQIEQDGKPVEVLNIAVSRADDRAGNVNWALMILTPQDVHLSSDFGLTLGAKSPQIIRYRNCNVAGCWVVIPANDRILRGMKRALDGAANFRLLNGQVVRVVFSLRGFTRGFAALTSKTEPSVSE